MPELTPNEQNFILLLRSALANRPIEPAALSSDADSGTILRLAYDQKLYHMILSVLPEGVLPASPDRRTALISQIAAQVTAANTFLDLFTDMEQAGFHPLGVKGIVCRSLYPQPDLRPSGDEDLYVSPDEFEPCCSFLQSRGMIPDKALSADRGEIGWRSGDGLFLELHRDLFEGEAFCELRQFFDFRRLDREVYATPYGKTVASLHPHDHFLYLLLHAYKHFVHSGFGIRQVCDIGMWAQKYGDRIDWPRLSDQCRAEKLDRFAAAVLGIARHDLQIAFFVPDEFEATPDYGKPMLKDILCGGIYGTADTDRQHSATMTLNAVKSERTNTKFSVLQSIFPSGETMQNQFPYVKKRPLLLPIAWMQRIIRYAKRSGSGAANPAQSLAIGKERIELLRYYGIVE
ncbi:MAG: nucleotidyltransferase family protein [Clostridia bacterium]|nr:nucleotidyltransferase family protein [Clostridia bacterium]